MNIKQLENWYQANKRELPFRKTKDPYHIWVSEVMLQQTQMETVIPYFNQLIRAYPTIKDLANTNEENLFSLIQGLGYYRRFKNMHKAAKTITKKHQGKFPKTYQEIINLSGIGEYTAGAIMSIAYNQPKSATDGNVIRVLSRVNNINLDMRIEKNKKIIKKINQEHIEKATPKIYTQAIMELGALICKPKKPNCEACPLQLDCKAYKLNKQSNLPFISKKAPKKIIHYNVFIIEDESFIYLRKRTETLLGGMYEYPQYQKDMAIPFNYDLIKNIGQYKHVFTHLVWKMNVLQVNLKSKPLQDWLKINKSDIIHYPMATAHKKIKLK